MIIRFFKFTKLPQVITAMIVSLTIMIVLKNENLSINDFYSLTILYVIFLLSIFIISKNSILKNNQFTTLGLIVFSGLYFKMPTEINTSLSYFFLLLSIRKIYSLKSNKSLNKKLVDIGFWLSASFFLNPYNILFLFTVFSGIYMFYKLDFKSLFKILSGFLAASILIIFYLNFTKGITFSIDLFIVGLKSKALILNKSYSHWTLAISLSCIFVIYMFKYFGNNLSERLKNLFLLIFFLNSLFLVLLINEYSIFLFFPFLVTLIKIISELKINLLIETVILAAILINAYPF